jgi:transposase
VYNFEGIQFDKDIKLLISNLEKNLESKDQELESKEKEIKSLKNENEYLKAIILNKNRKIFGKSSEKYNPNQLSMFNEAEAFADPKHEELETEEISYTRNKKTEKRTKKDNLANLKREVIHHYLSEDKKACEICTSEMIEIGTKTKEILKYKPAELTVEEHITHTFKCGNNCEDEDGKTIIVSTKAPRTLLHKSMASNEILSHVISLKYLYALPLDRQEKYFKMLGLTLSKQTLSNWIVESSKELKPVYDFMKEELIKRNYIQADETTVTLTDKKGDETRTNHYMWLYKSGTEINPIILFEYQKTRSGSNPKNFLNGFNKFLQTDGYSGYNRVENVELYYCLAHIRRKFFEIIEPLSEEARKDSIAFKAFMYCEKLYDIEKWLREDFKEKDDYFKIRHEERLKKSAHIIDEFEVFLIKELPNSLGDTNLGKALLYAKNHIGSFRIFLKDGSLEIDNNAAERSIKSFVIGRRNWLFFKNKNGADASSILYSIIETAKANNLMVEKYLTFLINELSNFETIDKYKLNELMPWSNLIPDNIKIPVKNTSQN